MKINFVKILILVVALALLFGSCALVSDEDTPSDENKSEEYLEKIAALEKELEKSKAEFLESESLYKQTIIDLQTKLAILSSTPPPSTNPREESVKFHYRTEDGRAIITGYEGNAALLSIPDTLDGYPVISIGERAFEGASITAVILPEGIHDVGWFAFYNCQNLINITIPQSVCSIGYAVFDGCGALTVYCPADSYAERYARSYGLSYVIH